MTPLFIILEINLAISNGLISAFEKYYKRTGLHIKDENDYVNAIEQEKRKAQRFIIVSKDILTVFSVIALILLILLVVIIPNRLVDGLIFDLLEIIIYGSFLGAITCSIAVANFKVHTDQNKE